MKEISLNEAVRNPAALIDYLTYRSYAHNREISPHITPERWRAIFSNVDAMEQEYQAERSKNHEK